MLHHPPKFLKILHPKSSVLKDKLISSALEKHLVIIDIATTYAQVTLYHLSVSQVPPGCAKSIVHTAGFSLLYLKNAVPKQRSHTFQGFSGVK